jgi:hypothetical protein
MPSRRRRRACPPAAPILKIASSPMRNHAPLPPSPASSALSESKDPRPRPPLTTSSPPRRSRLMPPCSAPSLSKSQKSPPGTSPIPPVPTMIHGPTRIPGISQTTATTVPTREPKTSPASPASRSARRTRPRDDRRNPRARSLPGMPLAADALLPATPAPRAPTREAARGRLEAATDRRPRAGGRGGRSRLTRRARPHLTALRSIENSSSATRRSPRAFAPKKSFVRLAESCFATASIVRAPAAVRCRHPQQLPPPQSKMART